MTPLGSMKSGQLVASQHAHFVLAVSPFMHECNEEKANIVTETKGKISCCSESLCNSVTRDQSFLGAAAFVLFAVLLH
ncbi:hypothetical protein L596_029635 [Steinernema carpocapsae]|uniref:Uncharacterized protein n=1 Tax=Steinernema carpocapsae TaxID=34508 RepID=A0A4U5LV72_STECR|nr:hypothetical protein L596_029635 [Steinernema carpocapsae]